MAAGTAAAGTDTGKAVEVEAVVVAGTDKVVVEAAAGAGTPVSLGVEHGG